MKISLFGKRIVFLEIESITQKEDTKEVKLISLKNILILIGIFIFLASAVYMIINFSIIKIADSPNNIGDTIGGITAPILNTFSIIILYYAFNAQIKANKEIMKSNEIMRDANNNQKFIETLNILQIKFDYLKQIIETNSKNFNSHKKIISEVVPRIYKTPLLQFKDNINDYFQYINTYHDNLKVFNSYLSIFVKCVRTYDKENMFFIEDLKNNLIIIQNNLFEKNNDYKKFLFHKQYCHFFIMNSEIKKKRIQYFGISIEGALSFDYNDINFNLEGLYYSLVNSGYFFEFIKALIPLKTDVDKYFDELLLFENNIIELEKL